MREAPPRNEAASLTGRSAERYLPILSAVTHAMRFISLAHVLPPLQRDQIHNYNLVIPEAMPPHLADYHALKLIHNKII